MINLLRKILPKATDNTDAEVEKLRQKVILKTKQVEKAQERFEKTTTYYVARAAGVLK